MTGQFRIVALPVWPGRAPIGSGQEVLGLLLGVVLASALSLTRIARWIGLEAFPPGWSNLRATLARDEADADALMQLGTLYGPTHQPALARRTFRPCLESHGGATWRWEIQQALARLADG
jgi:hypothetical protein